MERVEIEGLIRRLSREVAQSGSVGGKRNAKQRTKFTCELHGFAGRSRTKSNTDINERVV